MKGSKEAILGSIAALAERDRSDIIEWRQKQAKKVSDFVEMLNVLPGVNVYQVADKTDLPFSRVRMVIDNQKAKLTATEVASDLKLADPSIWVMDQHAADGKLDFELVQVNEDESETILNRLKSLLA